MNLEDEIAEIVLNRVVLDGVNLGAARDVVALLRERGQEVCAQCGKRPEALVHQGYSEKVLTEKAGLTGTMGSVILPHRFGVCDRWLLDLGEEQ